ncbi:MAG: DUF523 domain-containing protein [Desulfovibrio sp.]|nr:DUF523 domain-containing protein [Desulfovibrio sp.]
MAKAIKDTAGAAPRPRFVVSGCLAGLCCRYDGGSNPCPQVVALVKAGLAVPVCPESLSGLPVPRPPCEQVLAGPEKREVRVLCRGGEDVTAAFERGAERALAAALASGAREAILKARSPSCGVGAVYDGSFSHTLRPGDGLWAKRLREAGFRLWTEDSLPPDMTDDTTTP